MEGLKLIPYIALVICISGIILGAAAITLGKFSDSVTSKCYNSTYVWYGNSTARYCYSALPGAGNTTNNTASGLGNLNVSEEYYNILQSKDAISTVAEQQPTVAIIAVMVIIISIIAGVFAYMRYFG